MPVQNQDMNVLKSINQSVEPEELVIEKNEQLRDSHASDVAEPLINVVESVEPEILTANLPSKQSEKIGVE